MRYNPPETRIQFSKEIGIDFLRYLNAISLKLARNEYTPLIESTISYHLHKFNIDSLREKFGIVIYKNGHRQMREKISTKINFAEQITMSKMFYLFQVPAQLADLELQFLNGITLTKNQHYEKV